MNSKSRGKSQLNHSHAKHAISNRQNESGSVIWFILLAVILLAALTMTISRSSDTVDQSGDRERARIVASDMMRYAKGIEQAVSKMRMSGLSENEISFENSFLSGYENNYCTTTSCRVFHKEGGGQNYRVPTANWLDAAYSAEDHYGTIIFTSNPCIPDVGNYGEPGNCAVDVSTLDLMMIVPFIKRSICLEINRMVDLGVGGADPPKDDSAAWDGTVANVRFTGRFNIGNNLATAGNELNGATVGCFEGDTRPAGGYHFYYTLVARPGG